jgi:hypothetical protein
MAARRYESYLLRLWESDEAGQLIWRASLESTDTGERRGFADLVSLFAYLSLFSTVICEMAVIGSD